MQIFCGSSVLLHVFYVDREVMQTTSRYSVNDLGTKPLPEPRLNNHQLPSRIYIYVIIILIKICAEYRDMLPRPRLVRQKPALRPIGLHFPFFFIPLCVWLRTLQDCQYAQCPLPLSIVIRMRLVIRQSKLPACLAEVQLAQNTLWHLNHSLVKMTDKIDEICINRKFSAQEPSEWRYFSIPVSNFTVFQPRI